MGFGFGFDNNNCHSANNTLLYSKGSNFKAINDSFVEQTNHIKKMQERHDKNLDFIKRSNEGHRKSNKLVAEFDKREREILADKTHDEFLAQTNKAYAEFIAKNNETQNAINKNYTNLKLYEKETHSMAQMLGTVHDELNTMKKELNEITEKLDVQTNNINEIQQGVTFINAYIDAYDNYPSIE